MDQELYEDLKMIAMTSLALSDDTDSIRTLRNAAHDVAYESMKRVADRVRTLPIRRIEDDSEPPTHNHILSDNYIKLEDVLFLLGQRE